MSGVYITMGDLLEAIRDALAADSVLGEYCVSEFGRSLKIFLGFDPRIDGVELGTDYPFMSILASNGGGRSDSSTEIAYEINIAIAVYNDTRTESGNTITYEGFPQVENLRNQIEDALFRAEIQFGIDIEGGYSYEQSDHPRHISHISVTPKGLKDWSKPYPY